MQRQTSFPLRLELLEDRLVLSASSTAYQVVVPPQVLATVAQVQADVQQAEAQAQQQYEAGLIVVQQETAALQPSAVTPSSVGVANQNNGVGTSSTGTNQNQGNNGSGIPATVASSHVQAQTTPSVVAVDTTRSLPSASVAVTAASVNSIKAVGNGSGSETANAQTGLTAPPTSQQLSHDANAAALSAAGNPALVTDSSGLAATLGREGATDAGRGFVAAPAMPSYFTLLFSSGEGVGSSSRMDSAINTRPVSERGVALTGAGQVGESSPEVPVPTLLAADLLNGSAPQDSAALDLGVRQFLGQLDDLGREVTRSLRESSIAVWVAVAAAGFVTYEVVRRRRRARLALGYAGGAHRPADSWVPGLSGPLGSEAP
jgi:hypothetical protein